VFRPESNEEKKRIIGQRTDLLVGCFWLCCWTWNYLVFPYFAQKGGCG